MNWFNKFFKRNATADVIAFSNKRLQGKLVSEDDRERLLATYNRRLAQFDAQIIKWTNRKTGLAYTVIPLTEIRHHIKSITIQRDKYIKLIEGEN